MAVQKDVIRSAPKVTLKTIAERLGLTTGTVSATLNNSAAARAIPEHTKKRILDAARELNYRPNYFARSLRLQRTFTIGVIAEQIGDPYGAMVITGIEEYLRSTEYFFLTVIHRHDLGVLHNYSQMLMTRGVEGFITVDTSVTEPPSLPTVAVAGHAAVPGSDQPDPQSEAGRAAGADSPAGVRASRYSLHEGPDLKFRFCLPMGGNLLSL